MKAYQLVIFDFDGVIVDSAAVKQDCFLSIAEKFGSKKLKQQLERQLSHELVGAERIRVAEWVEKESNFEIKKETFLNEFASCLNQNKKKLKLIDGFKDYFHSLLEKKIKTAIVSAAPRQDIFKALSLFKIESSLFSAIYSAQDGTKVDSIQKLLKDTGIKKEDCLFYGDMPSDYKAAKTCLVDFIRVQNAVGDLCEWPSGINVIKNFETNR